MFLISLGTALPEKRYSQRDCWEALQKSTPFADLRPGSRALLRKVLLGENGITHRHLALDKLEEAFQLNPDALHARFSRHATSLATAAGERALERIGMPADAVDALIISTCTGYLCPGLTSHVSERLGLRPDAFCMDLVGQGCGAAMPNLRAAEALLASARCKNVLSICVEICSAAMYLDDDPGVLISACLFGDGASAAVLSSRPHNGGRSVEWKATGTILSAGDREHLRFEQCGGMLRNILARHVPAMAGVHSENLLRQTLGKAGVAKREITGWILHAGGRDVLAALRERFALSAEDLRWSTAILRDHGNLSSASVLFVLEAALNGNAPGGCWWMTSFGAGFSCHGALLKVD